MRTYFFCKNRESPFVRNIGAIKFVSRTKLVSASLVADKFDLMLIPAELTKMSRLPLKSSSTFEKIKSRSSPLVTSAASQSTRPVGRQKVQALLPLLRVLWSLYLLSVHRLRIPAGLWKFRNLVPLRPLSLKPFFLPNQNISILPLNRLGKFTTVNSNYLTRNVI